MKIALVYSRLGTSKWFAPLMQAAIASGHTVECFLDHRDISRTTKAYEFPLEEALPPFPAESVSYLPFHSMEELEKLVAATGAEFLFTIVPLPFAKKPGQRWAHIIPCLHDSMLLFPVNRFDEFDVIFCNTEHWADKCVEYFHHSQGVDLQSPVAKSIRSKLVPVGSPQNDHIALCDKETIRKRWGWPQDRKVVTVYAFETSISLWASRIFHESSRLRRLLSLAAGPFAYPMIFSRNGLRKLAKITLIALKRFPIHLIEALRCPSEEEVLRAVQAFCRKNNYYFVIKSRRKNPLKPFHEEVCDFLIREDSEYYPYTSAQVIAASDLVISFYSSAAVECVAAGTPFVNLHPSVDDLFLGDHYELQFRTGAKKIERAERSVFYETKPGTVFNFRGVIRGFSPQSFVKQFPNLSLADFSVDPDARMEYLRTLVDPLPGKSSAQRIIDSLVRMAAKRANPDAGARDQHTQEAR